MEFETAEKITTLFLKYFRETLQSAEEEVNEWRLSVWKRALGAKYAHLAGGFFFCTGDVQEAVAKNTH